MIFPQLLAVVMSLQAALAALVCLVEITISQTGTGTATFISKY